MNANLEDHATNGIPSLAGKYLAFLLGCGSYGLPVLKVREIIRLVEITSIPHTPACIKGVINLRGKVIPVVDLRVKFNLTAGEFTQSTCIIVGQVSRPSGPATHVGFIVDGVEEVINLTLDYLEKTPDFGMKLATDYLLGIANIKGRIIALLDIDQVVDNGSLRTLNEPVAA